MTAKKNEASVPRDARAGVPNLSMTMYLFSISTDEPVPLKFRMTNRLSKTTKIY